MQDITLQYTVAVTGGLFGECSELRATDGSSQARSGVGGAHCTRSADRGDSIMWAFADTAARACVFVTCGVHVYDRARGVLTYFLLIDNMFIGFFFNLRSDGRRSTYTSTARTFSVTLTGAYRAR